MMKRVEEQPGVYRMVPDSDPREHVPSRGELRRRGQSASKRIANKGKVNATLRKFIKPCIHLGPATGEQRPCDECGSRGSPVPLHICAIHGRCTEILRTKGVKCCTKGCDQRQVANNEITEVRNVVKTPEVYEVRDEDLLPDGPQQTGPDDVVRIPNEAIGRHQYFNCSIVEFDGQLLLAVRAGWSGANLAICELDPTTFMPRRTVEIYPHHDLCHAGREDPRLFVHRGKLHLFFSGVQKLLGKIIVHPMLCRLESRDQDYHVAATWSPKFSRRQHWEKNWGMFSREDELYAVHTIAPHIVLHVAGEQECFPFSRHDWRPRWAGGLLRGGAAPALVGGEYYCFFHGAIDKPGADPKRIYTAGVYTFQARPPFKPMRYTPEPILWPLNSDRPKGLDISVCFPCGAVLRGDQWLMSYGYHDKWCEVATFDRGSIERAMVTV